MSKTLILHIGMHKTGSSSLQNFLHINRDYFLENHNIDYFSAYANHSKLGAAFTNNHRHFSRIGCFDEESIRRWKDQRISTLKDALNSISADRFIISGEGFSHGVTPGIQTFYDFVKPYFNKFKIVFYAREPISFSTSCAQQFIKSGMTIDQILDGTLINPLYQRPTTAPIENGPETLLPNYKSRLEPFVDVFGKENIIVRNFSGGLIGSDVISDFLTSVLNINHEDLKFDYKSFRKNESLDHEFAWFLEQLNRSFPPYDFSLGRIKYNENRPRSLMPVISNAELGNKFRLLDFDFEKLLSNAMSDILWLKDFTKGEVDYTRIVAPKIEPGPPPNFPDSLIDAFIQQARKTDQTMHNWRFLRLRHMIEQKLDYKSLFLVYYDQGKNANQGTQIAATLIKHGHIDDALWLLKRVRELVEYGAQLNKPERLDVLERKAEQKRFVISQRHEYSNEQASG